LIAGHGRIPAAKKLKIDEVPVVVARGWSEAQKRAYVLADIFLAGRYNRPARRRSASSRLGPSL
jgi:ParB-like chromosome segregation protein Spo0J